MAKDQMLNFRVKPQEMELITKVAKAAGMTRSEFIRNAVFTAINRYDKSGVIEKTPQAKNETKCPFGPVNQCTQAQWNRLPTGIKVCGTCGTRKS